MTVGTKPLNSWCVESIESASKKTYTYRNKIDIKNEQKSKTHNNTTD
jgi:hypothetical protein